MRNKTHIMELVQTYSTGAQEWHCPICDYRFVVCWEPLTRIRLANGDDKVQHCGGAGGLVIRDSEVEQVVNLDMRVWGAIND